MTEFINEEPAIHAVHIFEGLSTSDGVCTPISLSPDSEPVVMPVISPELLGQIGFMLALSETDAQK